MRLSHVYQPSKSNATLANIFSPIYTIKLLTLHVKLNNNLKQNAREHNTITAQVNCIEFNDISLCICVMWWLDTLYGHN